jgi:hypothetical protein
MKFKLTHHTNCGNIGIPDLWEEIWVIPSSLYRSPKVSKKMKINNRVKNQILLAETQRIPLYVIFCITSIAEFSAFLGTTQLEGIF